jgi:hypothetical protein
VLTKRISLNRNSDFLQIIETSPSGVGRAHKGLKMSMVRWFYQKDPKEGGGKLLYFTQKISHWKLASKNWNIQFWNRSHLSHPGSRKLNRSLHTCAQDVQITRTANNMVNRYIISLNYKLESLQNDPWVQKKHYRVARKSKHRCILHRHNRRRGRPSLYLLAPAGTLGWTPAFGST